MIVSDNGTELTSNAILTCPLNLRCYPPNRVALHRDGQADAERSRRARTYGAAKLTVESFNGRMRDELLNEIMFRNLAHARIAITAWATDDNTERPHSDIDYQTPAD